MACSMALLMRALWGDVRTATANASEATCSLFLVNSLMDCSTMCPTASWELMETGDSEREVSEWGSWVGLTKWRVSWYCSEFKDSGLPWWEGMGDVGGCSWLMLMLWRQSGGPDWLFLSFLCLAHQLWNCAISSGACTFSSGSHESWAADHPF